MMGEKMMGEERPRRGRSSEAMRVSRE